VTLTRLQKILVATVIIIISLSFITIQLSRLALDVSLDSWEQGAEGYVKASREQQETGNLIALYFYTDWCENCKYLREEVLSKPNVSSHFSNVHPVKINPERGLQENSLAEQYGVIAYPSFYLVDKNTGKIQKIHKTNVTPERFIEQIKHAKLTITESNS